MATSSVEVNGGFIMSPSSVIPDDYPDQYLDRDWMKNAFLLSDSGMNDVDDVRNRYWSSASAKFTDARLGCNIGINSKPQFTRYADIRVMGRNPRRNRASPGHTGGDLGMGRYYSEAIDDPSQTIYLRFGVPQYSGMLSFLSRAFDSDMVALARTGRASSLLYTAGKALGTLTTVVAFPQLATAVMLGKAVSWMFSRPRGKFYTVKPTMHTYWATVESLVNNIAVTRGLLPKIMDTKESGGDRLGQPYRIDTEQLEALNNLMPEVFGGNQTIAGVNLATNNYIKVNAIVNRAQRLANQTFMTEYEAASNDANGEDATNFEGYLKRGLTGNDRRGSYITTRDNGIVQDILGGGMTLAARLNEAFMFGQYKLEKDAASTEIDPQAIPKPADENGVKTVDKGHDASFASEFITYMDAEFRDGSQFAVFKVDHTGSVQEGFSNAVQESDLSNKINGVSSTARQMRFTLAEGNMTGSALEGVVQSALGAVGDVVKGVADGVTLGFSNILAGLAGAGYIDIPKHWQSSSVQLPQSTYKIQLISPYGNVVSQLQNIYIPFCMLLAGVLPLSTGKASYTSPYLCQLYDRGRCQIQNGMIQQLSVTRGTSNLAFNTKGNPLAIDVTFSVVDLSSIMHMPISSGGVFDIDTNMDDDNIMADYIAVLAGQDLYTQMYAMPKAQLRIAKALTKASRLTSPAAWAASVHSSIPDVMKNVIEGFNRGSSVTPGSAIN